jgi:ApeA N-terminal domain 1
VSKQDVLDRGGNALNDGFEYQGTWWLPGADIHKVPGILKFDPDAGATLNLLGSLKGLAGVTDPLEPEIILGISSDGRSITT